MVKALGPAFRVGELCARQLSLYKELLELVMALSLLQHTPLLSESAGSTQCHKHGVGWLKAAPGSKKHQPRSSRRAARAAGSPGGGVLDRPTVLPGFSEAKQRVKKRPPIYRLMLHNDNFNRREYVVTVLMKVVDGVTVDDAVNIMQEAHINGLACVITCPQEDAERYCEGLRGNGLVASVEPASGSGSKGSDGEPC